MALVIDSVFGSPYFVDTMKVIILSFFIFLPLMSYAANSANFRCWSDPGFSCVIKIDVENEKVCSTGCDGQNYECENSSRTIELLGISDTEEEVGNKKTQAKLFSASSKDGSTRLEIAVFNSEFARPYFPEHMVSPANLRVTSNLFGYATTEWTRIPDGIFNWNTDFYCLSERYFVQ